MEETRHECTRVFARDVQGTRDDDADDLCFHDPSDVTAPTAQSLSGLRSLSSLVQENHSVAIVELGTQSVSHVSVKPSRPHCLLILWGAIYDAKCIISVTSTSTIWHCSCGGIKLHCIYKNTVCKVIPEERPIKQL